MAVISGRLCFVGLPPRSVEDVERLSADWRSMYLDGRAGLISEASIASTDPGDETQLYVADAYYTVKRSLLYDLRLASRYFFRLLVPARRSGW
jgi:lipopolysaccharide/colanic/teichoic acid biosynthesis glycosyltransferase